MSKKSPLTGGGSLAWPLPPACIAFVIFASVASSICETIPIRAPRSTFSASLLTFSMSIC